MLGLHATDEHTKAYSEEELRNLITLSHQSGHLIADEQQLIHNVFDFTDATVESVMTPRTELEALDANLPLEKMLELFEQIGYSRMPVYRDSLDNVIGIALLCTKTWVDSFAVALRRASKMSSAPQFFCRQP